MRPLDRYRKQLRREEAEKAMPGFTKDPEAPRRNGPRCLSMICRFEMPDGSTFTAEGVWPAVDHLPLDILARAVAEKAGAEARKRGT